MTLLEVLRYGADHLIMIMAGIFSIAVAVRVIASRSGKVDEHYFNTFVKQVEKCLEGEDNTENVPDVENWIHNLLTQVSSSLPNRSLRFKIGEADVNEIPAGKGNFKNFRGQKESFAQYAEGKKSITHGVRSHMDAFKSPYPPNYYELSGRILDQDKKWKTILGFIPFDVISRVLDILPGLFIIGGIFGTFIGITSALPKISNIDLANITMASEQLESFVRDIAFSMNTSIVGIICSVALTVLNTVFPISSVREKVHSNLSRAMEHIWLRLHGAQVEPGEARIIELLKKVVDNTDSLNKSKSKTTATRKKTTLKRVS